MNTLAINTQQSAVTTPLLIGMTAHSGIIGDKDDLFILEPTDHELNAKQGVRTLYELAKLTGKRFVSWQPVQVDLNFNQTGTIMVFHEFFGSWVWTDDVIRCTPNEKLIEHVKSGCK